MIVSCMDVLSCLALFNRTYKWQTKFIQVSQVKDMNNFEKRVQEHLEFLIRRQRKQVEYAGICAC
jgi:hypothetical protein